MRNQEIRDMREGFGFFAASSVASILLTGVFSPSAAASARRTALSVCADRITFIRGPFEVLIHDLHEHPNRCDELVRALSLQLADIMFPC